MKDVELKVLATGTAVAAKRAAEKAVQELRTTVEDDVAELQFQFEEFSETLKTIDDGQGKTQEQIARSVEIAKQHAMTEMGRIALQIETRVTELHGKLEEKLSSVDDAIEATEADIRAVRVRHAMDIEEGTEALREEVEANRRAAVDTLGGLLKDWGAAESISITSACIDALSEKHEQLAETLSATLKDTSSAALGSLKDDITASQLEMAEALEEYKTSAGEVIAASAAAKLDEIGRVVNERLDVVDTKRAEIEETAKRINDEFGILTESVGETLLKYADFQERVETEVKTRTDAEFEVLREGSREAIEETAKRVNDEFGILTESVGETLLKYADFQERVESEVKTRTDAEFKVLREGSREAIEEVKQASESAVASTLEEMELKATEYLDALEVPDPIPGPTGEKGMDGSPGAPGRDGNDGIVTRVLPWDQDRFYCKGQSVSHAAGLWQCVQDGDEEPGQGEKWVNLARGIADISLNEAHELRVRYSDQTLVVIGDVRGPPGREWEHKGTYDAAQWYTRSDVVVSKGTSYVAVDDSPGECPGPGWRMVAQAQKGPAGKPGRQGKGGDPGPPGPVGAPGISISWRGAFEMGQTYNTNDACSYNGGVWIALQRTSVPPKADGDNWDPMIRGQSSRGGGGNVASASGSMTIVTLTQAEYDALSPPLDNHLYLVCG